MAQRAPWGPAAIRLSVLRDGGTEAAPAICRKMSIRPGAAAIMIGTARLPEGRNRGRWGL